MDSQGSRGHSPGHLLLLGEEEQYGLRVEQQPPDGQAEEQHNEDALLQDVAHTLQIMSTVRLQRVKHSGQRWRRQCLPVHCTDEMNTGK